jgi:hypothetical protein
MKDRLLSLLGSNDLPTVVKLAGKHKRVLSLLTALTYHDDPFIVERAIQAFGPAARQVAAVDPEYVRIHLRRLFWLLTDESGGIAWRAPELIAGVLAACPGQFDEFQPMFFSLQDMEPEDRVRFEESLERGLRLLQPAGE